MVDMSLTLLPLILDKVSVAKVLDDLLGGLLKVLGLLHLGKDVVTPGVELVHAADLKIDLLDHPELQVLRKVQHAELVNDVKMIRSVKVQDRVEGERVTVEVDLIVSQGVGVHQLEDVLVRPGLGQHAEPGERPLLQHPPHDLVLHTAQVDHYLGVVSLVPGNGGGVRGLYRLLTNENSVLGHVISIDQ